MGSVNVGPWRRNGSVDLHLTYYSRSVYAFPHIWEFLQLKMIQLPLASSAIHRASSRKGAPGIACSKQHRRTPNVSKSLLVQWHVILPFNLAKTSLTRGGYGDNFFSSFREGKTLLPTPLSKGWAALKCTRLTHFCCTIIPRSHGEIQIKTNSSSSWLHPIVTKVNGCYLVTFLTRTPLFQWCGVRCGSKNKHHQDTCLKEIGLHL